jgi:hypothetical protein
MTLTLNVAPRDAVDTALKTALAAGTSPDRRADQNGSGADTPGYFSYPAAERNPRSASAHDTKWVTDPLITRRSRVQIPPPPQRPFPKLRKGL